MYLAERLIQLREAKGLSQGGIERRTGLLRCYISRVENGHTVPSLETLEKLARALDVPLYQLFYDGEDAPETAHVPPRQGEGDWASKGKGLLLFTKIRRAAARMTEEDRKLILYLAEGVSKRRAL